MAEVYKGSKLHCHYWRSCLQYCDEFLVHAVDVEGKNGGIETGLVRMLSDYDGIPVTYAGGVHSWDDIELLKKLGKGKIDMTIEVHLICLAEHCHMSVLRRCIF